MTAILNALTAIANAIAAVAKNAKIKELRELRKEQKELRLEITTAARSGNSTLISELQNQLDSSYSDGDALRTSQSNEGK